MKVIIKKGIVSNCESLDELLNYCSSIYDPLGYIETIDCLIVDTLRLMVRQSKGDIKLEIIFPNGEISTVDKFGSVSRWYPSPLDNHSGVLRALSSNTPS